MRSSAAISPTRRWRRLRRPDVPSAGTGRDSRALKPVPIAADGRASAGDAVSRQAKQREGSEAGASGKPRFVRILGPGLIAGASDDDPSGIATYSQAGAQLGFSVTWTLLFSYPLMAAIQEISARIGRTTGKGIAANIRSHYPNWVLQVIVVLLLVANTINIGADLGAMGDAIGLMIGGPTLLYVLLFAALCTGLEIFVPYESYEP